MKRLAFSASCLVAAACSNGETTPPPAHEPAEAGAPTEGCDGRGQPLEGLSVSAKSDDDAKVTLEFVDGTPMPPIVGNNSWTFRLKVDGEALTGAESDITMTPFMPDHGHGTPTAVTVEEVSAGTYRFQPVHTRMEGLWEIRVDVEREPHAVKLVFGVCVE